MRSPLIWPTLALALAGCVPQPQTITQPPGAPDISAIAISALPGWAADNTSDALAAFIRGCKTIAIMPADQPLGGIGLAQQTAGQAGQLQNPCTAAAAVPFGDNQAAKTFFTAYFTAYKITEPATINGYFEPEFPGSKNPAPGFYIPLYAKPADADLASLPRLAIDQGALTRKTPVTAYVSDPVDAAMLQIYGAGRIELANGRTLRIAYDGQNGQPNTPIGRTLVQNGDLAANNISYQTINAWLRANPAEAKSVIEQNPYYVFLRPLGPLPDNLGAPGTLGVPLTAGRSLAVDRGQIPLGLPVFIATTDPVTTAPLNRLVIAQDTGGGIHGADQADLFFGAGPDAEATAGRMMQPGTIYLLLPRPPATS